MLFFTGITAFIASVFVVLFWLVLLPCGIPVTYSLWLSFDLLFFVIFYSKEKGQKGPGSQRAYIKIIRGESAKSQRTLIKDRSVLKAIISGHRVSGRQKGHKKVEINR